MDAAARWLRRAALAVLAFVALAAAYVIPWAVAEPSHARDWQEDLIHLPEARRHGDSITIRNLRDFVYSPAGIEERRWTTASFHLHDVQRAWFFLSPFHPRVKAMAHPFLSFELSDGRFIAASFEARKEKGEEYSALRGIWPTMETILVLGTEEDVAGLRAVVRAEPLHLFPLRLEPGTVQALFVALMERARAIEDTPEFYHTVTNNCTTNLIDLINALVPDDRVLRIRGLVPGYSVEEVHRRGWLDSDLPLEVIRPASRVDGPIREAYGNDDFSRRIRERL